MMTLATIQTDPVFGAKDDNIRQAIRLMRSTPADLYVLPELFASGYNFLSRHEAAELAEALGNGPTFEHLGAFARESGSWIVFGFAETDGGRLFNSSALIGPNGTCEGYRKIHLFDREQDIFTPGDRPFAVHQTPVGRIGMMVCFDWYFPESARTLALKGAQIIAHPSNLVLPNCPSAMPVRSLENRVFAATSNRVGTEHRGGHALTFIGQSQITSHRGEILHRSPSSNAEAFACAIDPALADNKLATERSDLFADRRPEMYFR